MLKTSACARVVAVLVCLGGAGCARHTKGSETARRTAQASGELGSAKDTVKAKIEDVDPESRAVTLRDAHGQPFTVLVGDDVNIDRLKPNDEVSVSYEESLAFSLLDPRSEAARDPGVTQEASRRALPDGVQFGRQVKTTVEIVSIAPDGTSATFRVPEGELRTVEVDDPTNQKKVSNLRPGDAVEVTYTERLALALNEAP